MIKKPITIQISNGLEARPVAMLVQVASQYESRIQVESGDKHRPHRACPAAVCAGAVQI